MAIRVKRIYDEPDEPVEQLLEITSTGTLTLLYAAKDSNHNNAVVLQEYIEIRLL